MPRCSDPNTCKYDRRLSRSCNGSHALFPSAVFFSLEVFSDNISPWYQASRACRRPPVCHSGATRSRISDNPPPPPSMDVHVSWFSCLKRFSARRIPTPSTMTWTTTMHSCRNSGVAYRLRQAERPYRSLGLGGRLIICGAQVKAFVFAIMFHTQR